MEKPVTGNIGSIAEEKASIRGWSTTRSPAVRVDKDAVDEDDDTDDEENAVFGVSQRGEQSKKNTANTAMVMGE